jgi:hypothetical protein
MGFSHMAGMLPRIERRILDRMPAVLVVTVAADAAVHVVGAPEVSEMPALPWWTTPIAAVLVIAAFTLSGWAHRASSALWAAAAALLVLSSLPRLPHDLFAVISSTIAAVTGGAALFEVSPPWFALSRNVLVLAVGMLAIRAAVVARRRFRGVCSWCGTADAGPPPARFRLLQVSGIVAIVAPLPYLWLKLSWSTGSSVGLADPDYFSGVTLTTPGFGDSVALGVLGMSAAAIMLSRPRHWISRSALVIIGLVASAMLLPIGTAGAVMLGVAALGVVDVDSGILQAWVFTLVYVSFLAWGAALAIATWQYWSATRGRCPSEYHGASSAPLSSADR